MKTKSVLAFIPMCLCMFFLQFADAEVMKIPLYKLAPVKALDLKCLGATAEFSIAIPERWKLSKAVLDFSYTNSTALLASRSRMVVKLNGFPVEQFTLTPQFPDKNAKIVLPELLFEPGYNRLTFEVAQHYANECEDICAKELWTTLRLDQAFLELEYTLRPIPQKLSSLDKFLFDPKLLPYGEINIVVSSTKEDMVTNAGIVASSIAKKFDYKKVVFTVSQEIKPGVDNVIVGESSFVTDYLKQKGITLTEIKGPFLKVMNLPTGEKEDAQHALLIISGKNADHVKLAAETMAIISYPYPDDSETTILELTLPDITLYGGRQTIVPNKQYTFKTMDFTDFTFIGFNSMSKSVSFRLSPDFFIKPNQYAEVFLTYSYGAGMRSDSVLNILINNVSVSAIRLDNPSGGIIEDYRINIPTHMFKVGANLLTFVPVLVPSVTKNCELPQFRNLFLTIFGKSSMKFPAMPHIVDLPKLELFMSSGFPITRWPDGYESLIYLTNNNFDTIASAFNLIGFITQKNGYPLFATQFTYTNPKTWKGDIMVIGDVGTIPENIKEITPIKLTAKSVIPYPIVKSWGDEITIALSKQMVNMSENKGALMEFESPYAQGKTAILLTAAATKDVFKVSEALLDSNVQGDCKGDLNIIDLTPPDYKVISLSTGKKYFSGKTGVTSRLDAYLYVYPWLYYVAIGLAVTVIGSTLYVILKAYRKRRLNVGKNSDSSS
ncbi:cellulose biosynthesis cyclic di-GMP-binding regulatory protein BcsB [Candidatus Magnetomonas plexicatena]|uniref:cellulose biosynthesis cyclic di-GMP-binding regulatory protein BcsB n=1 Tax=Candidatus Magnetomonas plexicatena TaxID=2552947 RepID=UPI001C75D515|nr:cellulose biosynthesis cyclic di-GMP-binding regulatory protein BcsB [Nitrospirales bacterium LBB_01]